MQASTIDSDWRGWAKVCAPVLENQLSKAYAFRSISCCCLWSLLAAADVEERKKGFCVILVSVYIYSQRIRCSMRFPHNVNIFMFACTHVFIHSFIHSCIQSINQSIILVVSIAPLQVLYYSEALPTTARILYRSLTPKRTGNCK